jgi:hypothetical protein
MDSHPVVHLVEALNGHVLCPHTSGAHDCWCEPAKLYWVKNVHGVMILVVEHNDYTLQHRQLQLVDQANGIPEQLAWINHALYDSAHYPTAEGRDQPRKALPPHEGDTP